MAKDNIALLTEISNQLKTLNKASIRNEMSERVFRERQDAQLAGGPEASDQGPQFIDPAEDFRRRVKGSISGAILGEKFTDSGKRARGWVKKEKERKKNEKIASTLRKDKRVGLSDILDQSKLGVTQSSLIKVNTDKIVQMLGGIREVLGMQNKQDKKQDDKENKRAANAARLAEENKREKNKEKVIKQAGPMIVGDGDTNITKKGGLLKWLLLAKALPLLIGAAAVALAVGAIKDFISGWKEDGLAGAIGKAFGGEGSGMWNAIKQSFKLGGLGAIIGSAIGLAFFGVGAIPGAIIGGLIGMAIGAITGFFGGEKITAGLKGAGKVIGDGWNKATAFIMYHIRRIGEWFYRPGQPGAAAGPHGSTKTEIFGGFISWDPGNFSIGAMWDSAMTSIWGMVTGIGEWFWKDGKAFGGRIELPTWDEIFGDFKTSMANMWAVIANIPGHIKRGLMSILPDWMLLGLGWIKAAPIGSGIAAHRGREKAELLFAKDAGSLKDVWFGDSKEAFLQLINSGALGATNAGQLDGNLVGKMTNFDEYGNWIGPTSNAPEWVRSISPHSYGDQRRLAGYNTLGAQVQPVAVTDASYGKNAVTIILNS
jgi:hypothetical protein